MTEFKPSRALIETRDHARERANWQAVDQLRVACNDHTPMGTPKPRDHVNCGGHECGCTCHAPTDAERALWQQIADEIDSYINDEQPTRQNDLFGEPA